MEYSDREIVAIREAAFTEAKRYCDNLQAQLERAEKTLLIAQSLFTEEQRGRFEKLERVAFGG